MRSSTAVLKTFLSFSVAVLRTVRNQKMLLIVWLFSSVCVTNAELYTALADLAGLLDTEYMFMETLDKYIAAQENRIHQLRKQAELYRKEHSLASGDIDEYLSNPINAYLLVKRLTTDWKNTETLITEDDFAQEAKHNFTEIKKYMKFPSDEDLSGAATALIRLQDTYKMDTASLAKGELNGVKYTTQLSASDCFELGRQSYNNKDHHHTVLWMSEALMRHTRESNRTDVPKWEILEYLAYSTFMQGNVKSALELTDELLQLNPDHKRAQGNRVYYIDALEKGDTIPEEKVDVAAEEKEVNEKRPDKEMYELACRGLLSPPPSLLAQLKCRYVTKSPFTILAPLKEEEAYLKPKIILYREVMYHSEIEIIKQMAHPRLKRATVQNYKTGELEIASYRISKSAWFNDNDHEVMARLTRRVEDMTGLTMKSAEDLQVVNYGIGGHYEPHYDFARKGEETHAFKSLGTGNRIATVLFYMSDVAQGGATVFPQLNLSLWPEKGTAAFWMNLLANGEGDYDTRHAACPVLAGTKWVSNRWIHEREQEFRRPCSLDPNE